MKKVFVRLTFRGRYSNGYIVPVDVNLRDYFEEGEIVEVRIDDTPVEPSGSAGNEKLE